MITMKTFFLTVILTSALAFPAQQPAPAFTAKLAVSGVASA